MVDDFETKRSDVNPYEMPIQGMLQFCKSDRKIVSLLLQIWSILTTPFFVGNSLQSVRLELAKEAEAKMMKEMSTEEGLTDDDEDSDHGQEVTSAEFLFLALEIEHQQ
jgi:hypothetical protein